MRTQARVVVIGGGAVGASCLFHLTQAGIRDCLLIEKDELCSGSTWHAAGNIPTYATSWLGMRAGNYAWRLYKELALNKDAPVTYRHTGAFWPAHSGDRMDLFNHIAGLARSAGFELHMLTPSEMEKLHPYYKPGKSVIGGIHDPYEGDIDPNQLTQALTGAARLRGADVARFTEVKAIKRSKSHEWHVCTDHGDVTCEIIVNASGFYGSDIGRMVDQPLPIAVLEHQYLITDSLDALEKDQTLFPLVRDPDIRFYLRRERNRFLLGSYAHPGRLAFVDGIPGDFSHALFKDSVDDIIELIEQAIDHVPLLGEAGVQRFVNGPIAYTPDALPLCGPAYGLPNFYHACGIQIGITQSAAVGKAVAEWITAGETEWDYSAWDPRRFGDWATRDYTQQRTVELYDLQYSIPFPHRIIQSGRPLRRTPLYKTLEQKSAVFGQIGGWERAFWFDPGNKNQDNRLSFRHSEPWRDAVKRECEAVRDRVGIMDHGGFTKFEVSGAGASQYLNRVFCGRLPPIGRVRLSYMLTPGGKIWSEATIARPAENHYLLCGPTLADQRDHDWLRRYLPKDNSVSLRKGSNRDAVLMIMGPRSRDLLSQLSDCDLSAESMPWMSVAEISLGGCDLTAMRVSYVGELGWELHLESKDLQRLYHNISTAGRDFGLADFGSYALNSMRIEKAYHAWGSDFGTEYTLFDAGLEKFIHIDKADFIGRETVLRQRKSAPDWHFVRLVVDSTEADPLPGDPIISRNQCVGYVTSGGTGFRTGKCLALGYTNANAALTEDHLAVQILGQNRPARLSPRAFYDPDHLRCRS